MVKVNSSKLIFNEEEFCLLLDVIQEESTLHDLEKIAKQKKLLRKKEFHITLIGKKTGEALLEKAMNSSKIASEIQELVNNLDWKYFLQKEYYFISKKYSEPNQEKEERQSIIQIVRLPDLVPFYKKLNQMFGTKIKVPFPHLTLFTNSTNKEKKLRGIGIYSEKEFYDLKPVKFTP